MSSKTNVKHTKEQILRLLDRALEQEELLVEKIRVLESELSDCRKKAANPRHELEEQGLPASKISFRLDYYRTDLHGPLKGIIEHLPSGETQPFSLDESEGMAAFVQRFLFGKDSEKPVRAVRNKPASKKTPKANTPKQINPKKSSLPVANRSPTLVQWRMVPEKVLAGAPFQIELSTQGIQARPLRPLMATLQIDGLENERHWAFEEKSVARGGIMHIPLVPASLDAGEYRIKLVLKGADHAAEIYHRESRVIVVHG